MKTKTKPPPDTLPGDWVNRQYEPTKRTRELVLPEPQAKFIHPEPPGKRDDGRLWFDDGGKAKQATEQEEIKEAERIYKKKYFDQNRLKPRDVRRGDRWLPWHFMKGE